MRTARLQQMAVLAALSALAYMLMVVGRIPVVLFLSYDPKDIILVIGGFLYGPLSAAAISFVVSVLEMFTVSKTGVIGLVMNMIASCSFACVAALIYKKKRTQTGAVVGLVTGCICMLAVMLLWNWLISPLYMNRPRHEIAQLLIPVFLPFNLLKGALNAALTLILYKPLQRILRLTHMLPTPSATDRVPSRVNIGVLMAALFAVITCVMAILVWRGML